jgi:hypothetical protein
MIRTVAMTSSRHVYEICPHKDKRGVDLICDSKIVLGGTAALHTCGVGVSIFSVVYPPVFDCRIANDPATINKESTNENNTDVDGWVDARRLRINGKPCSQS